MNTNEPQEVVTPSVPSSGGSWQTPLTPSSTPQVTPTSSPIGAGLPVPPPPGSVDGYERVIWGQTIDPRINMVNQSKTYQVIPSQCATVDTLQFYFHVFSGVPGQNALPELRISEYVSVAYMVILPPGTQAAGAYASSGNFGRVSTGPSANLMKPESRWKQGYGAFFLFILLIRLQAAPFLVPFQAKKRIEPAFGLSMREGRVR